MTHLSKDLKWTTALAVVLAFATSVMASADARHRNAVGPAPIAYTQHYCYCVEPFCYIYCPFTGTLVRTPDLATAGPVDSTPTWSPDATHVAFTRNSDIVVMDATAGTVVNITNSASAESSPAWSPDGQRIAFLSDRDGLTELYLTDADGSNVARVTNGGVVIGRPTWSADSTRLAFPCLVESFNGDICAIDADGTDFLRLTNDPADDRDPAWSPDGSTIAFATLINSVPHLAFMRPDGSNVALVGDAIVGSQPAWSPDGRQIAFSSWSGFGQFGVDLYTMRSDGTAISLVAIDAAEPAWKPGGLFASFSVSCSGLTCMVDAAHSVGSISAYAWNFGDQTSGTGSVATHTYALGGQYTIELSVTDASGATATRQEIVDINAPPVASLTVSCDEVLTCVLDPSASHDPGGAIVLVEWNFGDGNSTSCSSNSTCLAPRVQYYRASGTYTVTLRVTDAAGATSEVSRTFTLVATPAHIGDLDAAISPGPGPWDVTLTIQVHTASHGPHPGAVVAALWNNGVTTFCVTDAMGRCTVRQSRISPGKAATVTITGVTYTVGGYLPAANHDPDGDSNGTTITVSKR